MPSLESYKKTLLSLKEDYTARIMAIDKDISHQTDPVEKDSAEQVTQGENDEVLSALKEEALQNIVQIDEALNKISAGRYGLCSNCHQEISSSRLIAIPFAEYCITCAENIG